MPSSSRSSPDVGRGVKPVAWLLDASTTRGTPARRAASSTQWVPSMLACETAAHVDSPETPARWTTAVAPETASAIAAGSVTSATTCSSPGRGSGTGTTSSERSAQPRSGNPPRSTAPIRPTAPVSSTGPVTAAVR